MDQNKITDIQSKLVAFRNQCIRASSNILMNDKFEQLCYIIEELLEEIKNDTTA